MKRGIDNTPRLADLRRMLVLCKVLLEPLREEVGPLIVTSGYRIAALNAVLPHASPSSAHRFGCAADVLPARSSVEEAWLAAKRLALPYDQAIWERLGASEWLHIAIERPGENPRAMHFKHWR